jgi:hypothetical protein
LGANFTASESSVRLRRAATAKGGPDGAVLTGLTLRDLRERMSMATPELVAGNATRD